ncbi:MAG TPA: hypothetical protein VE988_10525, partial [Gemmataceae bacterium]|nr:hypothetical protein [Gemmataceae bacterium]
SRKIRREAWAAWWRTVDGSALLAAFRQRTLSEAETAAAEALIEQLGDKSFSKREKALQSLLMMGPKVIGLLREAARSKDLEQAQRAQKCLKQLFVQEEKERLPSAAPRLLTVRKPAGACEALLGYLPFTDDVVMKQEVGAALKQLALVDGKADPGVIKALSDPMPVRKLAAADALVAAGGATHPAVRKLLTNADPQVRLRVAMALVHAQDRDAMPALIDVLADLPRAQAGEVEELLQRLAGAKAPKIASAKDDAATRKKLRDAWQAWWKQDGPGVDLAQLANAVGNSGLILVAELGPKADPKAAGKKGGGKKGGGGGGFGGAAGVLPPVEAGPDRLVALDRNGQVQWKIEGLDHPIDFQILLGDRVLIAEYKAGRVTERDLKGKILWEANTPGPPMNVQRLANGNTFIACYGTPVATGGYLLVEVDRQGKTVATFNGKGAGAAGKAAAKAAGEPRGAFKTANGQMICLTSKGICIRLDATGKEVNSFTIPQYTSSGIVLSRVGNIDVTPKGHIVLMQNDTKVGEFNSDGKLIWQAGVLGNRANRLPNGNTLVASEEKGVVEIDTGGKTVWQYQPPPGYQAVRARQSGAAVAVAKPFPIGNAPNAAFGGIDPRVVAAWEKAGAKFEWIEFAGSKQLRMLDLKGTGVTDKDLKALAGLKQLQTLYLGNNAVTDAGIRELVGLTQLQTLGLGNTNVSDAGLKELAKLKQLQHLTLTGAAVTPAGIAELQQALPNLTVNGGLKAKGKS